MSVRSTFPYLDEAGHVYLPLVGAGGSCLRLNAPASKLWRQWLGEGVDLDVLNADERRFFEDLCSRGALVNSPEGGSPR